MTQQQLSLLSETGYILKLNITTESCQLLFTKVKFSVYRSTHSRWCSESLWGASLCRNLRSYPMTSRTTWPNTKSVWRNYGNNLN